MPAAENKYSKKGPVLPDPPCGLGIQLFEVTVQQTLHAAAMAGFVLCHFMHGVMDGIQIQSLCLCCQSLLACICRFFLVLSVRTSPSSSANLEACSASSKA